VFIIERREWSYGVIEYREERVELWSYRVIEYREGLFFYTVDLLFHAEWCSRHL